MASKKPETDKEIVVVAGTSVPIYFDLIEKINTTMQERKAGRNVRISLNQVARLTNGELGRLNPKGAFTKSRSIVPSDTPPMHEGTPDMADASSLTSKTFDMPAPSAKRARTLESALEPLTLSDPPVYEKELGDVKPTIQDDPYTPAIPCVLPKPSKHPKPSGIADIVNRFRANPSPASGASSGAKEPRSTTEEKKLTRVETPRETFKVKIDPYGKPIYFLQDPPLPGPRAAETVPFVPATHWDDAYFESRMPTVEDVYAGRKYMTDLTLERQPVMFTRAVALARKEAMVKLKEEQKRKIREEKWKEIVADVRGPDDPPKDMKCRRCCGTWMKVMDLTRTKDSPDGKPRKVRSLVCRNYCCYLILQQNVTWEVGRLFGHPKKEELQYGRSRIDPKMNGDPTPRMVDYLEDLAIYRWVLRQEGNYEEYPYTLVSGQKEPVRMM